MQRNAVEWRKKNESKREKIKRGKKIEKKIKESKCGGWVWLRGEKSRQ